CLRRAEDSALCLISNFVDAPAGAMDAAVFVAFAGVAPVEHEDAAVRAITEFHAAKPGIAGNEEVGRVFADVTAAAAFEDFLIGTAAVEVQREQPATILGGPIVALVNHHADV